MIAEMFTTISELYFRKLFSITLHSLGTANLTCHTQIVVAITLLYVIYFASINKIEVGLCKWLMYLIQYFSAEMCMRHKCDVRKETILKTHYIMKWQWTQLNTNLFVMLNGRYDTGRMSLIIHSLENNAIILFPHRLLRNFVIIQAPCDDLGSLLITETN